MATLNKSQMTAEGAVKPSSLEVDSYDHSIGAYRSVAIQHGVGADGSTLVPFTATNDIKWDTITPTYNSTSDVYVFKQNSVTTCTITVSYADSTKAVLTGVTKVFA